MGTKRQKQDFSPTQIHVQTCSICQHLVMCRSERAAQAALLDHIEWAHTRKVKP